MDVFSAYTYSIHVKGLTVLREHTYTYHMEWISASFLLQNLDTWRLGAMQGIVQEQNNHAPKRTPSEEEAWTFSSPVSWTLVPAGPPLPPLIHAYIGTMMTATEEVSTCFWDLQHFRSWDQRAPGTCWSGTALPWEESHEDRKTRLELLPNWSQEDGL